MIPNGKQIKVVDDWLKRLGQASFKVIFMAARGDSVSDQQPVADVTIVATDSTGAERHRKSFQMSAKHSEFEVVITILDRVRGFKRFWRRLGKRGVESELYNVTITVEPQREWKELYSQRVFCEKIELGVNTPRHVSLQRKRTSESPESFRVPQGDS
jgi:hypothetical protein